MNMGPNRFYNIGRPSGNLKMNKVIHKRLLTEFEKPARGKLCFTIWTVQHTVYRGSEKVFQRRTRLNYRHKQEKQKSFAVLVPGVYL